MKLKLEEVAKLIDATILGDSSKEISGINTLDDASSNQLSYVVSNKYKKLLINSNAGAVIIDESLKDFCSTNKLLVKNVYLAYAILSHKFKNLQNFNHLQSGSKIIRAFTDVDILPSCLIGKNVFIGENW